MRRITAFGLLCALAAVAALAQVSVGGGTPGTGASSGGPSFWNGTVAPSSIVGANGDFYLNTSTYCLYGPKATGAWPASCVSLIGQAGAPGPALGYVAENAINKGAANGYAPLDVNSLLPAANLPTSAVTATTVNNGTLSGSFVNLLASGLISTSAAGAGAFMMTAGASQTPPANTVGLQAPISVPNSFNCTWWGVPALGLIHATATTPCILSASAVDLGADINATLLPLANLPIIPYAQLSGTPTVPGPSTVLPSMAGTAAIGVSPNYALADHVHAVDTSRQAALGYTAENTASKGAPSGYAPLNSISQLPLANLPNPIVTAGVGGVTAGFLVARDNSNPTRYVATTPGGCGTGFAASAAAAGAPFQLYSMPGTLIAAIADNTITAGDILVGGSVIPGRVSDSGFSTRGSLPSTTCIVGIAQASALPGASFNVLFDGTGTYGTLVSSSTPFACTVASVATVACTHNLGTSTPWVSCFDNSNLMFGSIGSAASITSVVATSPNVATLTFSAAATGTCQISTGSLGPTGSAGVAGAPGVAGTPGGYGTVDNSGTALTARATLNLTGAGVVCVDNSGATRTDCTFSSGGMVFPGAGVANSTGSAWGTSYTVGTAASNLVQLNGSAQLPAVSAALLTSFPSAVQTRKSCVIDNDSQSATVLTSAQITGRCEIPFAATIVEVGVWGGTGTGTQTYTGASSIQLTRIRPNGGSTAAILSAALATPNSGTSSNKACALATVSGTCINGLTSSATITISSTALSAGDMLYISSATADAAQTWYTVTVTYTAN